MENGNNIKWKHLTEDDRARIAALLSEGLRFSQIGLIVGKDPTTISKEVKARRYFEESKYRPGHPCVNARKCTLKHICPDRCGSCLAPCRNCPWCTHHCRDFAPFAFECCREDKAPYVKYRYRYFTYNADIY